MSVPGLGQRKPRTYRDWKLATAKIEAEDYRCRVCGSQWQVERAHVIGREHDSKAPVRIAGWRPGVVAPDRIVPLCRDCHQGPHGQHAKRLDLLPYLTRNEETQAVADVGLGRAFALLMPSLSHKSTPQRKDFA